MQKKFHNQKDTYIDQTTGFLVFTSNYHLKRGYCCGSGCRHCPFIPRNTKNAIRIADDVCE
jgi:hypothetical protein